jgi:hypothetical protein
MLIQFFSAVTLSSRVFSSRCFEGTYLFIFNGKFFWDSLTLEDIEDKATYSFRTSGISNPATQCNKPEDLNPQVFYFFVVTNLFQDCLIKVIKNLVLSMYIAFY